MAFVKNTTGKCTNLTVSYSKTSGDVSIPNRKLVNSDEIVEVDDNVLKTALKLGCTLAEAVFIPEVKNDDYIVEYYDEPEKLKTIKEAKSSKKN